MARRKTISQTKFSSVILCFILLIFASIQALASEQVHLVGKVSQASGEITYLQYMQPDNLHIIKTDSEIQTGGSYLTHDSSYFTIKLFEGSWIKASPKSKFSLEFTPEAKILTIHLFSGSIKVLYSSKINKNQISKLVIKSADASFETIEAKLSVVRNLLTSETILFVEKGLVAAQVIPENSTQSTLIHSKEMTSLSDRSKNFASVRELTQKELTFLNSKLYLDEKNNSGIEQD